MVEKDNRGVIKVKLAYKLRKLGFILKRWGKWLKGTPCRWGYHEINPLWRPGLIWWRECSVCGKTEHTLDPKLEDINLVSYRSYLDRRSKESGENGVDARKKLVELDDLEKTYSSGYTRSEGTSV